jgi:hypothetical protein
MNTIPHLTILKWIHVHGYHGYAVQFDVAVAAANSPSLNATAASNLLESLASELGTTPETLSKEIGTWAASIEPAVLDSLPISIATSAQNLTETAESQRPTWLPMARKLARIVIGLGAHARHMIHAAGGWCGDAAERLARVAMDRAARADGVDPRHMPTRDALLATVFGGANKVPTWVKGE